MRGLVSLVRELMKIGFKVFMKVVLPALLAGLFFSMKVILYSFAALPVGLKRATDRIAVEWMRKLQAHRFPGSWDEPMFQFMKACAYGMIFSGWIMLAFLTVWLARMLF